MKAFLRIAPIILFSALLLSAGLQVFTHIGSFWIGWLGGAVLLFVSGLAMAAAWQWGGGGRTLAWMVTLAFAFRLGLGVASEALLPVGGYPELEQKAGYLSKDAYHRDNQAWGLAASGAPVWIAFQADFSSDQYGGLLALSAGVYRTFSPDAHRPAFIVILTALAGALGVPVVWRLARKRFAAGAAMLAGWSVALYPESLFWGASQMREPFLVSLLALELCSALEWVDNRKASLIGSAVSLAGLFFFSPVIGAAGTGALVVFASLAALQRITRQGLRRAGWVALLIGCLGLVILGWTWLQSRTQWDISLTEEASGWVQKVIAPLGEAGRIPAITLYGIARPVLPAALADPAPPIWKVLIILRALGWYALLPLLSYGLLAAIRNAWKGKTHGLQADTGRWMIAWLALSVWVWVVTASARGGGDASDNPRYRVIFLAWQALLAGWAWEWGRQIASRWLGRVLAVEGIFLFFFTEWYFSRYTRLIPRMDFYVMIGTIVVLSGGVLVGGWVWDRVKDPSHLRPASQADEGLPPPPS